MIIVNKIQKITSNATEVLVWYNLSSICCWHRLLSKFVPDFWLKAIHGKRLQIPYVVYII